MGAAFASLEDQLRSQRVLQYCIPDESFDGKVHELVIETQSGQCSTPVSLQLPLRAVPKDLSTLYRSPWFLILVVIATPAALVAPVLLVRRRRDEED